MVSECNTSLPCKVSVIIPVYNVEQYLSECLDTVLAQTYRDIEVIVVNDGSTDGSGEIARAYAKQDARVRYLEKPNGGLSDARNYGMQYATGDYVFFLDSDDYIDHDTIRRLVDFAYQHNCDVVQGGHYYLYDDHLEYDARWLPDGTEMVLNNQDSIAALIDNKYLKNFAWGKLYRRAIIADLKFPKDRYFEDSYWQYIVAHRANGYGVLTAPLCYYRQRPSSISGSASDRILDLLKGDEGRLAFIKMHYPMLTPQAVSQYWHQLFDICYDADSEAKREYWRTALPKYKPDFEKYLKGNLNYRLASNNQRSLITAVAFIKRVYSHFFAHRLKRLPLN